MKSTKKSLLMSVLSLVLCFAMLLGTTYAWFTDSVTSGTNRIIAGNLDVELEHKTATGYESVTAADNQLWQTAAFSGPTLWEPGAMAVETFKISNKGTLALKYQFNINKLLEEAYSKVTWDDGENYYDLTDVVKMVITDAAPATREAGVALFTNASTQSFSKTQNVSLKAAALEPGMSEEFSVVLYWAPHDNALDNRYNLKNSGWKLYSPAGNQSAITAHDADDATEDYLFLKPSVTLLATQHTVEADSFDNQYDAQAPGENAVIGGSIWNDVAVNSATAAVTENADTKVITETATATVTSNAVGTLKTLGSALIETSTESSVPAGDNTVTTTTETKITALKLDVTPSETPLETTGGAEITVTGGSTTKYFDLSMFAKTQTKQTVTTKDTNGAVINSDTTVTGTGEAQVKESAEIIVVELDIGQNLTNIAANHDGTFMVNADTHAANTFTYNMSTGVLTLYLDHFSPFAISYDQYVAKIGENYYLTLGEAVNAASGTDTITLISSFKSTKNYYVSKDVNLVVEEGVTASFSAYNGIFCLNYGCHTFNISGAGTIRLAKDNVRFISAYNSGQTINIDQTTFEGGKIAELSSHGHLNIAGGTFRCALISSGLYNESDITISGGAFSQDYSAYAAAGKAFSYDEATQLYHVVQLTPELASFSVTRAADNSVEYYASLDSYTDERVGDTIKLLKDVSGSWLFGNNNTVIDLNGKTWTASTDGNKHCALCFQNCTGVVLKNGTVQTYSGTSASAAIGFANGAHVTLENVTAIGQDKTPNEYSWALGFTSGPWYQFTAKETINDALVTIKGGTFTSEAPASFTGDQTKETYCVTAKNASADNFKFEGALPTFTIGDLDKYYTAG